MTKSVVRGLQVALWVCFSIIFLGQAQAGLPFFDSQGEKLPSLAPMLEKATPAVVNIATSGTVRVQENPLFSDPLFRHFFDIPSRPRERKTSSLGSGVIVDAKKGYIITNNHVIAKADEITVTLRDGRSLKAKLIGTDPDTDVAIIQVPAENLTALPMSNSEKLRVGDFAIAIGNPFGLGQTVTSGIVSATHRSMLGINTYENYIQTDAAINPGNSGGALIDARGNLIGINTAIFSKSGGSQGIGFAIPVALSQEVLADIIKHGRPVRGWLGVEGDPVTDEIARALDLEKTEGIVVVGVLRNGPAHKAGIEPGDVIIAVDGKPVVGAHETLLAISRHRPGTRIKLDIIRDGKKQPIEATVIERPTERPDNK